VKATIPEEDSTLYVRKYAKANQLKRGIDVMLRIERNFRFSRLNFSVGLLPIYRITNDEIEDPSCWRKNQAGRRKRVWRFPPSARLATASA
jgi:hypothetical protein